MNISIRESSLSDSKSYTNMMQKTYADAYVNDSLGLTSECFSVEVFNSIDTQEYLKGKLVGNEARKTWVACDGNKIVGAVTVEDNIGECEMSGFYVRPSYQGKGIGKLLWVQVLEFAKGKDITLDIYTHNIKTIKLYTHWGFKEDSSKPHFYRHWPEWPEGLEAESMYMRYTVTND